MAGLRVACLASHCAAADSPLTGSAGQIQSHLSPRTIGASHTGLSAAHSHAEPSADGSLFSPAHLVMISGLTLMTQSGAALCI